MKSLHGRKPIRITRVPCIEEEHHEIRSGLFGRKFIGAFANRIACHTTDQRGIYDDDAVTIPRSETQH
ncbi:MAG: hypothetical protein ACLFUL_12770 [Desulfobacteraceae bacterium]